MRQAMIGAALAAMLLVGGQGAFAQSNPFRPVVYVNDAVVTEFDIQQRARFLQILRAPDAGREAAEKALIDDRLRMYAAKQMGIKPSEEAVNAAMTEFAARGGLSPDQFTKLLAQNGVDAQIFYDFIVSGVVWREVVRARLVPNIQVSDAEIDQEFTQIVTTPRVTDVLLSEMIIPAPQGEQKRVHDEAARLVSTISNESEFAAAARQYSATRSRENGGRLPWAPLANLPPTLRPIIMGMEPGQVSQPLDVEGAVVVFMLRDTRGTVRAGAESQVLDYLTLRTASQTEAARIAASVRSCADLYLQAKDLPPAQLTEGKGAQGSIPSNIALYLATLDNDEATVVGNDVVMLCKREPALLAEAAAQPAVPVTAERNPEQSGALPAGAEADPIPQRSEVRDVVFNRKVTNAADGYLAELRADAIIRR